jgi:hypothetical protein
MVHGFAPPLPPNRTGRFSVSGSPSRGLLLCGDWHFVFTGCEQAEEPAFLEVVVSPPHRVLPPGAPASGNSTPSTALPATHGPDGRIPRSVLGSAGPPRPDDSPAPTSGSFPLGPAPIALRHAIQLPFFATVCHRDGQVADCAPEGILDIYTAFKIAPDFGNDPSGSFSSRTLVS